jgi:MFS family permease
MIPGAENGRTPEDGDVLSRDFVFLFIASFLFLGSLYLLIPVLPLYMVSVAHASTTQVGILMGVLTFASFLLRMYVGHKADEMGRKPFLLLGAAIFIAASLLYIPARSVWTLVPVLVLHGAGIACFHTASLIYIGDIAPVTQRGKSQAWFQTSFNAAVMAAPPIGLFLKDRLGYTSVFVTASVVAAASLLFIPFVSEHWIPRITGPARRTGTQDRRRLIVLVSVAIFAGTATLGCIEAFLGLFAESARIGHFALFFTVSGGVLILLRLAGGSLIDRLGRRLSVVMALLALGASMLVLAAAKDFAVLCLSAVVWGAGFAFCSPALSAMLMDRVPPEELGRAFGVYTAAFEAGIVFGAMVMGPAVSALGFRQAFVIIGCLCGGAALFFALTYKALAGEA